MVTICSRPPLTFVVAGCGSRARTYSTLASQMPNRYRLMAAADPDSERRDLFRTISTEPGFRTFESDRELFAAGKLADVAMITTQDEYHVAPCIRAMELGYDIVLEKPIAQNFAGVLEVFDSARKLGRKVLVCHVLRYAPFYQRIHDIVSSGILGEIFAMDAREGVGRWHQAHSYVRGHWSVTAASTPMIVAKSCHDCDILSWLAGSQCTRVSSFGSLSYFRQERAPAKATARCTDGCPLSTDCEYDAMKYATEHRSWLKMVHNQGETATTEEIREFLTTSRFGRCVWHCDNDAVDHQVVSLEFASGLTASLTMTAFDEGRELVLNGTKGTLRAGDHTRRQTGYDIRMDLSNGAVRQENVPSPARGYVGHFGGDFGFVNAMDHQFALEPKAMLTGLPASIESHRIAFAAEKSRISGQSIDLQNSDSF